MEALTNAFFNIVKIFLALEERNMPDWSRFLVLEAFAFLAKIFFFDFAIY